MQDNLPAVPLDNDVIDMIARQIGLNVTQHIETMYPEAARAVAWSSCKISIRNTVRNGIVSAGIAAEKGKIDGWIRTQTQSRAALRKMAGE